MRNKLRSILAPMLLAPLVSLAAQVVVIPGDAPGQGFNDPTPALPVGGNSGATIGQQALNVFQRAADIWGSKLQSAQPITVIAFFRPLSCTATSAVLGSAAPYFSVRDVAGAQGGKNLPVNTWHPIALAEKITRVNIDPLPAEPFEIITQFNNRLGQAGCLNGSGWYYGLDNAEPGNRIDLLAVVLHEFGHGLGFTVGPTSGSSGVRAQGLPSVWEQHMLDVSTGKRWIEMTNTERAASARNDGKLVWAGQKASNVVPSVLDFRIELDVIRPTGMPTAEAVPATFGPALVNAPGQRLGGNLALALDGVNASGLTPTDGCTAITNPAEVAGRIALIDRGTCGFAVKVKNAQNAGAVAVLIANNVPTGLPGMGGADPSIVIPSFGISSAAGAALRAAGSGVYVELSRNPNIRAGTTAGFPRLFAPSTFQGGSSVSHWDVTATRNLLMEPSINGNLTSSVKNPEDLTRGLFMDIGW